MVKLFFNLLKFQNYRLFQNLKRYYIIVSINLRHDDVKYKINFLQNVQFIMVKISFFKGYTYKPELFGRFLSHNIQNLQNSTINKKLKQRQTVENIIDFQDQPFFQQRKSSIFIYKQDFRGFRSIGVMTAISLKDYQIGIIKKHQKTLDRHDRNAQTFKKNPIGPVTLGYQNVQTKQNTLDTILGLITDQRSSVPIFSQWKTADGRQHTLWMIEEDNPNTDKISTSIISYFSSIKSLYILDGHHRFDAAYQNYTKAKSATNSTGQQEWIQGIMFSQKNIQVHAQHRKLKNISVFNEVSILQILNNMKAQVIDISIETLIKNLKQKGQENKILEQSNLVEIYDIIFISKEKVKGIILPKTQIEEQDQCSKNLASCFLDEHILMPLFQGCKQQLQNHLQFIPGISILNQINRKKSWSQNQINKKNDFLFIIKPLTVGKLFRLADNQKILPPKSTWLEPKPCLKMIVSIHS